MNYDPFLNHMIPRTGFYLVNDGPDLRPGNSDVERTKIAKDYPVFAFLVLLIPAAF